MHTKRQAAFIGEPFQDCHIAVGHAHIVDARPAITCHHARASGVNLHPFSLGGFTQKRAERGHGSVDDHAGRPALLITQYRPAFGIRRGIGDASCFNRGTVGHQRMPIGADQDDGPVRDHRVKISGTRKARLRPVRLDPAAPEHHAFAVGFGIGQDPGLQIGDRGRLLEIQRALALANPDKMGMGVGKARKHGGAVQIDGLGIAACKPCQPRAIACIDYAAIAHGDGLHRIAQPGMDGAACENAFRRHGTGGIITGRAITARQKARRNDCHECCGADHAALLQALEGAS